MLSSINCCSVYCNSVFCENIVWDYAWFTLEMLYVVCARFTVEMLYQLVWALMFYARFTVEMLYGLMLGFRWLW